MDDHAKGYPFVRKYQSLLLNEASTYLSDTSPEEYKELERIIWNIIADTNGPRYLGPDRRETGERDFFEFFFSPLSDLLSAIDDIAVSRVYFKRGYTKRLGLSEEEYMRYHVNTYLNNLYIVKNRIEKVLKKVERYYKSEDGTELPARLKRVMKMTETAFKTLAAARGYHVHESKYADNTTDQIGTLCLLEKSEDQAIRKLMTFFKKNAFLDIRKKWTKACDTSQAAIMQLLDITCEAILEHCFVDGKRIIRR